MNEDEKAEKEVEAFIQHLEKRHGIKIEDLKKALRQHAAMDRNAERIVTAAITFLVGSILAAIGWLLYQGFIYFIEMITNVSTR